MGGDEKFIGVLEGGGGDVKNFIGVAKSKTKQ